ncbi:glycosyltransferase family 2 protein [Pseudorhodoferax sp. Leaf274]|uniref:glycosyltransferase family 2 protein n=1 Tax=Pseudorhodoferax sp. Leaf274 TaxID=1736318 RepID=UPI000702BFC1|nr:glycosyltransferase family 2 protein [Pseudorhodoferax sp. Leaf274]KQP39786.1 hypothetical protein ASF44_08655 [Pseudorhodoferax sp. Leaf274]
MNLYGVLIARDEADIIEHTLLSLRQQGGFTKIFFYDNGSSDGTLAVAKKFTDIVASAELLTTPFSDQLKYQLLNAHAREFKTGDWMAILDADELYAEPPLGRIEQAESTGANCIESRSAQFYMTPSDASTDFDPQTPAIEQRCHYLINYGEPRLFKHQPEVPLTEAMVKQRLAPLRPAPETLLINHFQYRSATQVQRRIDIRIANNRSSGNWGHVQKNHWNEYLVDAALLHTYDGQFKHGLPAHIDLYKVPNNDAYTASTMRWMRKHRYLTPAQLDCLDASRLKRILRRFL